MAKFIEVESSIEESSRRVVKSIFPSIKRKTDKILSLAYDMQMFDNEKNHLLLQNTEYNIVKESMLLSNMIRDAINERGDGSVIQDVCNELVHAEVVEDGAVVHVILNCPLPRKFKNTEMLRDLDMEYLSYANAINKAFLKHDIPRYTEKVIMCFKHIYLPGQKMLDHDNIEIKTVIDAIALNILQDDNPSRCAFYMDYEIGDYRHTEIDIVPEREFCQYLEKKNCSH